MKKITFTLLIAMLFVLLAGCGPNYTAELNTAIDAFNAEVDKYDAAVEAFDIDDITDTEVLNAEFDKMKVLEEEVLANVKGYLEEIKGYEEGISDKEWYEETVRDIEDFIASTEAELASIPQYKEFYNLSMAFSTLADEWNAVMPEKYDELSDAEDKDAKNAAIDSVIALNEDYSKQMWDIIAKLEALDDEDLQEDIVFVIDEIEPFATGIDDDIATIEEMR